MNATFNIKVSIDANNVTSSFGAEKVEDMDTTLMASVLKVFGDVQNKVRKQVAQFYGVRGLMENEPTNTDSSTEEEQAPVALDGQEENVLQ